jgi:hypothetical protein
MQYPLKMKLELNVNEMDSDQEEIVGTSKQMKVSK